MAAVTEGQRMNWFFGKFSPQHVHECHECVYNSFITTAFKEVVQGMDVPGTDTFLRNCNWTGTSSFFSRFDVVGTELMN